jgi:hypothetical protein
MAVVPPYVLICHSALDADTARDVEKQLRLKGLDSWIGPRDVPPGADYADAIPKALDGAVAFALLYSANSRTSDDCKRELKLAQDRKLQIFPIRLDGAEVDGPWEYRLANIQWVEGDLGRLAAVIADRVGPPRERGSGPPRGDGPEMVYMNCVGYLEIAIDVRGSSMSVTAISSPAAVSTAQFEQGVAPLFEELLTLTAILAGCDASGIELGELTRLDHFGRHEFRRPVKMPAAMGDRPWASLECRVHLRGLNPSRAIDVGNIDVYVTPSSTRSADDSTAAATASPVSERILTDLLTAFRKEQAHKRAGRLQDDEGVLRTLHSLEPAIGGCARRIAGAVLGIPQERVWTRGPTWQPENLPVPHELWEAEDSSGVGAYVLAYDVIH